MMSSFHFVLIEEVYFLFYGLTAAIRQTLVHNLLYMMILHFEYLSFYFGTVLSRLSGGFLFPKEVLVFNFVSFCFDYL